MHVKNIPPRLVPYEYWSELSKLSKCALMDLAWSLTGCMVESGDDPNQVIQRMRAEIETVKLYRK